MAKSILRLSIILSLTTSCYFSKDIPYLISLEEQTLQFKADKIEILKKIPDALKAFFEDEQFPKEFSCENFEQHFLSDFDYKNKKLQNYPISLQPFQNQFEKIWDNHHPLPKQQKEKYRVSYLGLEAAEIEFHFQMLNDRIAQSTVKISSLPAIKNLYTINDKLVGTFDIFSKSPIQIGVCQDESKHLGLTAQFFNLKERQVYSFKKVMHRVKKRLSNEFKSSFAPEQSLDLLNLFLFMKYSNASNSELIFPITNKNNSLYLGKINFLSKETKINRKAEKYNLIVASPTDISKSLEVVYWISDPPDRQLLSFEAKTVLGNIIGHLVEE